MNRCRRWGMGSNPISFSDIRTFPESISISCLRQTIRNAVALVIRGRGEFKRLLKADNIDTVFRINPVDRIYGVMFIDHNAGIVANGSVLGRKFSAHVFNELFPVSENAERHAMDQHQEQKHEQRSRTANPVSGAVGTLLDLADARAVEEQQRIQRRRKRRL